MTEHGQPSTPSREQLIRAVKTKQQQIANMSQERDQLVETTARLDERLRQLEQRPSITPRISFPSVQKVRLDQPISAGIGLGIGLILAPLMLFLAIAFSLWLGAQLGVNLYDLLGGPPAGP